MYNPQFTGNVNQSGIGGPWKVTGYVFTNFLPPGSAERASVISDINAGLLQIAPHAFSSEAFGDLYWHPSPAELNDVQWFNNLNDALEWEEGQGGADRIPFLSASVVAHYWDLSNNTGADLWNTLGVRYVTSIQKPGFQNNSDVTINDGAERLRARPFWLYEQPPKTTPHEDQPFFFADDYVVESRSGLPTKKLFLFATQLQGINEPRWDLTWPTGSQWTPTQSIDRFKRHTWRFWSSMAPMQIFTHDWNNYELSTTSERRTVIQQLSQWLNGSKVRHIFMEDLGDYIYARTKSQLKRAYSTPDGITYVFEGSAANADGTVIDTDVQLFVGDTGDTSHTIPGFSDGNVVVLPTP
jgi:hypothetical protein